MLKYFRLFFILSFFCFIFVQKTYAVIPVPGNYSETNDCVIDPDGCSIPAFPQSCSNPLTVNKASSTGNNPNNCKVNSCGLDSAIARANQCAASQSATIIFDPAVFPASAIDLSGAGFSTPYLVGASHPVTLDGGSSRVMIRGNNAKNFALQSNSANVTFKNLIFENFKKSALVIGVAASKTDVRNVSIYSTSSSDDGIRIDAPANQNSNSNVPTFIRPGPHAGEFVAYVILPKDSEIHFYQKNAASTEMEWVGLENNLIPNPESGTLEISNLLDINKTPIDVGSVQIVAGFITGFSSDNKLVALVKNPDKNISIVKAGLPHTFFTDSDNDYLSDDAETAWFGTNTAKADSDDNKINDYEQVIDPTRNVPFAKKNPDGTYAFVAGNFADQATGQNTPPPASLPNSGESGGCMFQPNSNFALSRTGLGIIWMISGMAFLLFRTKQRL